MISFVNLIILESLQLPILPIKSQVNKSKGGYMKFFSQRRLGKDLYMTGVEGVTLIIKKLCL